MKTPKFIQVATAATGSSIIAVYGLTVDGAVYRWDGIARYWVLLQNEEGYK